MMIDDGDCCIKLAIVAIWKTVMLDTEGAKRAVRERLDELQIDNGFAQQYVTVLRSILFLNSFVVR
jgi:hypothetical protein